MTAGTVQQPPAELRLCDENNRQSIILTQYDEFKYIERWGAKDSFTLKMARTAEHAEELLTGRIILVPADQTHDYYRVLVILQIIVDEDTITASGSDYLWGLLSVRLANYSIVDDNGYSKTDHQTGIAETVARHYLDVNFLQASNTRRRDPFTVLEATRANPLGTSVDIEARLQTLEEIMESICTQGGINLYGALVEDDSIPRGWYIEARFSVGTNHAQAVSNPNSWVVLSEEYGNAKLTRFVDNVPKTTLAVVYGIVTYVLELEQSVMTYNIEYTKRDFVEVGDQSLAGPDRREVYVDAGDVRGGNAPLIARGNEELENVKEQSIELELTNGDMYNRDFTIGDTVTCDLGIYGAYNLPVTEVETEYTAEGTSISVVLGSDLDGVMTVIRNAIQATPLRRQ